MSWRSYPPQQGICPDSALHGQSVAMHKAYRMSSPAPEAHPSSTDVTPRTPLQNRSSLFDEAIGVHVFNEEQHLGTALELPVPSISLPRPQTPTVKRARLNWHGMPSPQTPSCHIVVNNEHTKSAIPEAVGNEGERDTEDFWTDELSHHKIPPSFSFIAPHYKSSSFSSGTSELQDHTELTPATSTEGDADLALQLSNPNAIVRRSTRLRGKVQTQERSELKPKPGRRSFGTPSPAAQEGSSVILTRAEPVQSPFEIAVASSMELPALYSTEWQLMYPSSGSTHPSYPWPSADPRLTFHAHYVPLKNGLPDVSRAPTLVLPPGWHHISWSGLCPVVFDPFQQAFKLTPVGPLPLTCEELHQGGLHSYVPGGRLHREYGMLPTMSSLSDGSDFEVYNFDGVDWVLPWACIGGIPQVEQSRTDLAPHSNTIATESALSVMDVPARYIEARDCPDNVFDIGDGWRWMFEIEQDPPGCFIPTPGRKWHGTGVTRTPRKYKQPVAALMAIAMAESEEDNAERYLGNQNSRLFCPLKSVVTPVHVNITLLGDTEFTLVELLSYFPLHYQWCDAGERMTRAGFSALDISNFINVSRCLPGASICSHSSVGHHVFRKSKDGKTGKTERSPTDTTSYTAEGWTHDVWEMTDYPLLALTHGLSQLPTGVDAGPLTALLEWVRGQGRYKTTLGEVPALLTEANIETIIDPGEGVDPDKEVLGRHNKAMKKDRLRVLKEIKALRKQGDAEAEAKAKASEVATEKRSKRRRLE